MLYKLKLLALFKFKIIAPALNEHGLGDLCQMDYFRRAAQVEYQVPGKIKPVKYKAQTFKKWLHQYRKCGFDGLVSQGRKDIGSFRCIDKNTGTQVKKTAGEYLFRTAKALYNYLVSLSILKQRECSYATFNTYAKRYRLLDGNVGSKKRKAFEKQFINMMWVGDIMYGPYIRDGRRVRKSYLIAFLDDHARFIVGAKFACEQDTIAVETILKNALGAYGLPGSIYLDNGQVFVTESLVMAAARLGFIVIHSKKGDAASRGKIERFFRTVRDQFLDMFLAPLKGEKPELETLNAAFSKWLYEYLHRTHSTTGESPHDRYMKGIAKVTIRKATMQKIERAFHHEITRKVRRDALVSINNVDYEVPGQFIGKAISLFFNPAQPRLYYVWSTIDNKLIPVRPVDRHSNARFPMRYRKNNNKEAQ